MKMRKGFVSNSSSSSFCVIGENLYDEGLSELCKKHDISFDYDSDDFWEKMSELEGKAPEGITVWVGEESCVVGVSILQMKDNETKKDFIKRANKMLRDFGIEEEYKDFYIDYICG